MEHTIRTRRVGDVPTVMPGWNARALRNVSSRRSRADVPAGVADDDGVLGVPERPLPPQRAASACVPVEGREHHAAVRRLHADCGRRFCARCGAGYSARMSQAVLVTGCSSGIGLATAEFLAGHGIPVFATVRGAADAERLAALPGVEPVLCDVRSDDDVARLRAAIDERGAGLWGLVNNAGVGQVGHLTGESMQEMHDVFDINVFGVHRVTNAVVDLLLESGGRIVNMSSISGTLSSAGMGVYSMSKHALEAYTDALWAELRERGVHVCAVAPGNYQSAIVTNFVQRVPLRDGASDGLRAAYEPDADRSRSEFPPPDAVAEACYRALFDANPHRRYLVTPDADESLRTLRQAAMELLQLHRAASHPCSHEELHALLDEVTALMHEQERPAKATAPEA